MSQTQLESLTAFFQQNVPPRAMQSFDSVLDEMKFILREGLRDGAVPPGGDSL
ncbi:Uncharacterised protein [Citrobacter freundii]|nr:Uncharacterised protein [Citrobacter freundii]